MSKNDLIKENRKIKIELNKYRDENEKLNEEIYNLKKENEKLSKKLFEVNKKISKINEIKINEKGNNNEINYLNEIIKLKEKEIKLLTIQLKNTDKNEKLVDYNKILVINFISLDNNINYGIKCLETDIFAEVEEKLYQKYEEYRETNNSFISGGKAILRFKTIKDNNIKNGDKVQLIEVLN